MPRNVIAGEGDDTKVKLVPIGADYALAVGLVNGTGTQIGTTLNPLQVSLANTGENSTSLNVHLTASDVSIGGGEVTVDGNVTVVQATATNLLAQVSNNGTFAVQAAQSGTWNIGTVTTVSSVTAIANALPAGTNAIGKLAANSGVDIGDVDVTSIAAGDNNIGNVDIVTVPAPLSLTGGGVEASALRVTIASDSTGVLSVDDNGASLTVDGSVTANAGTNLNTSALALESGGNLAAAATSLAIMDDWDESDRAKVNPIVGQAGVQGGSGTVSNTTQRVVLATDVALPAGTNAIGKLAANSGIDIGDVDVTSIVPGTGATNLGKAEDAGHTTGDTGVPDWGVRVDTPNATAAANGDYHYKATDMVGGLRTALYETDFAVLGTNHVKKYYTNAGAVTDGIVWSPAAGKRWYVTDIFINVSAAATVTLEDDLVAGDSAVWKAELAANSGWSHHFGTPLFSGEDAADLMVTTSAGNVYITITGYEI